MKPLKRRYTIDEEVARFHAGSKPEEVVAVYLMQTSARAGRETFQPIRFRLGEPVGYYTAAICVGDMQTDLEFAAESALRKAAA